jgi:hypothetical protein
MAPSLLRKLLWTQLVRWHRLRAPCLRIPRLARDAGAGQASAPHASQDNPLGISTDERFRDPRV